MPLEDPPAEDSVRIVAGKWRSRRLNWPRGGVTRPVPDRVREAIFNVLGAYYGTPGELPALHVADVFAGGGSMGLEALSRGAATCRFFERDPAALRALEANLRTLDAGPAAQIQRYDAWSARMTGVRTDPVDLILLDPPYESARDASPDGPVGRFLARHHDAVAPDALVVLHHESRVEFADGSASGWRVYKRLVIGSNGVTVFRRDD
ncbi:MAG: 16S rRNA (guanine(966)-N(2))-methyltransferase RsmD [Phycisphaerales bacterium]|nr:MAG: 16S rRNA (guanine(966)-N(2))-methyltransferase RsmD [Phycisphaerales bacterium]